MNTLKDILLASGGAFEEALNQEGGWFVELGNGDENWSDVKKFMRQQQISLLKGVIDECASRITNQTLNSGDYTEHRNIGYDRALEDLTNTINQTIKDIENV